MGKRIGLIFLVSLIFLSLSFISAYNFPTAGGSVTTTVNISGTYSAGSNLSLVGSIFSLDTAGVKTWLDNFYVSVSDIVSLVGNWSADKPDYFTSTQISGFNYYNSTDFDIADYVPYTGASGDVDLGGNWLIASGIDTGELFLQGWEGDGNTTINAGTGENMIDLPSASGTLALTSDLQDYRTLVNNTFTSNINISSSNLTMSQNNFICYDQACTTYKYYNGTCIIEKGPTSTLEIC